MAHELTWQFDLDKIAMGYSTPLSLGQSFQWWLKELITAGSSITFKDKDGEDVATPLGAWTLEYSCDGTTAGDAGDHVDRWTTPANCVFGTGGAARSWAVFSNTIAGRQYWLCLHCSNATATGQYVDNVVATAAFAGGSTTARPTSGEEFGSGTTAIAANQIHDGIANAEHRFHGWLATTGEFMFGMHKSGVVTFPTIGGVRGVVPACDEVPLVYIQSYNNTDGGGNCVGAQSLNNFGTGGSRVRTRYWNGTAYTTSITGSVLAPGNNTAGTLTATLSNFVGSTPSGLALHFDCIIAVGNGTTIKGRIRDLFLTQSNATDFDVDATTPEYMVCGHLLLPTWKVIVP
jgi:hypothetical protein